MSDHVNSPSHYQWLPVEAIEITELFNFNMGNALKYIIRADHKGNPLEDLRKAAWYIEREIARRSEALPVIEDPSLPPMTGIIGDFSFLEQGQVEAPPADDLCTCGHALGHHIKEKGVCRPGFACGFDCQFFTPAGDS